MKKFLQPTKDTVWTNPVAWSELEWKCRYAPHTLTKSDYLVTASILSAYSMMILHLDPDKLTKTIKKLRKLIKEDTDE